MKIKLPSNPRILITRTDRIGDLIVSTPVFQILREQYPQAHLAACVFSEHHDLIAENSFLNEVIFYEKFGSEKNPWGQLRFSRKIARKKFDCVIHLHATNRMHVMGWLAGIPIRIGYDRRAPWALTQVYAYDKKEGRKHESEYLLSLVSELLAQPTPQPRSMPLPHVPVSEKMRSSVKNLLLHHGVSETQKIIVIHPAASDVSKMWPAEKFAEFIQALPGAQNFIWISVGGREASLQTEKIRSLIKIPLISLCESLSLGMLAAIFEKAQLVISNDSGPAHIAAAVGAPTVSIFGRWQPGLNAERWRPLGKKTAIVIPQIESIPESQRKFSYVEDITVKQVLDAAQKVMA